MRLECKGVGQPSRIVSRLMNSTGGRYRGREREKEREREIEIIGRGG